MFLPPQLSFSHIQNLAAPILNISQHTHKNMSTPNKNEQGDTESREVVTTGKRWWTGERVHGVTFMVTDGS